MFMIQVCFTSLQLEHSEPVATHRCILWFPGAYKLVFIGYTTLKTERKNETQGTGPLRQKCRERWLLLEGHEGDSSELSVLAQCHQWPMLSLGQKVQVSSEDGRFKENLYACC